MWRSDVNINAETLESDVKYIMEQEESKSGKMKLMFDLGLSVKEIAQIVGVRYNFVYNVISNYVTINGIPTEKEQMDSKKDQIIELFLQGKTNREISKVLKLNYNYIYKVVREYAEKNTEALRPATGAAPAEPQKIIQRPPVPTVKTIEVDPQADIKEQAEVIAQEVHEPPEQEETTEETPEVAEQEVDGIYDPETGRYKKKVPMPPVENQPWKPSGAISQVLNRRAR